MTVIDSCSNSGCIYNVDGDCILASVYLDFTGECMDMVEKLETEKE